MIKFAYQNIKTKKNTSHLEEARFIRFDDRGDSGDAAPGHGGRDLGGKEQAEAEHSFHDSRRLHFP